MAHTSDATVEVVSIQVADSDVTLAELVSVQVAVCAVVLAELVSVIRVVGSAELIPELSPMTGLSLRGAVLLGREGEKGVVKPTGLPTTVSPTSGDIIPPEEVVDTTIVSCSWSLSKTEAKVWLAGKVVLGGMTVERTREPAGDVEVEAVKDMRTSLKAESLPPT